MSVPIASCFTPEVVAPGKTESPVFAFDSTVSDPDAGGGGSAGGSRLLRISLGADGRLQVDGDRNGDDTPFAGVSRVPPDSNLEWADGRLVFTAKGSVSTGIQGLSREEAVEQYVTRMEAVVGSYAAAAPRWTAVRLSGVQDSRHILRALPGTGHRPDRVDTQSLPPSVGEEDVRVAGLVCEHAGIPHTIVPSEDAPARLERQKNALTGLESIHHALFMPLRRWTDSERVPAFYDGLAGDVLSGSRYLSPERIRLWRDGDARSFAEALCFPASYIQSIAQPEFAKLWTRERAVARIAIEAEKRVHRPNPHNHFGLARARRVIAPALWPILGEGRQVMLPFLDKWVYELLVDLPIELSLGRSFHRDAISQGYPRFASLP